MIDNAVARPTKTDSPTAQPASNSETNSSDNTASFASILNDEIDATDLENEDAPDGKGADETLVPSALEIDNSNSSIATSILEIPMVLRLDKRMPASSSKEDQYSIGYPGIQAQNPTSQDELSASETVGFSTPNTIASRRVSPTLLHQEPVASNETPSSTRLSVQPSPGLVETAEPEALLLRDDGTPTAAIALTRMVLTESFPHSTAPTAGFSPPSVVQNSTLQPLVMSVHTGLYESYWAKDFSQQIVVLTRSNSDSAYIRLNPADLGPVQVTLNVADGQASASFVSQDERVRAAIEAALGDLKDALAKSGVSLTNTYVGSQSNPDRRGDEQFKPKKYLDFPDEQVAPTRAISSNVRSIGIDVFA